MKPVRTVPADQELEILKVVWQRGQATVREVCEADPAIGYEMHQ
jgi:hypothetical protein